MRTPRREPKAPVNRHRIPTPSPSASPSGGADEPRPFRMRATRDKHRPSPSPSPQPPQPASPAPASKEVSDKAAPSVGDGAVKAGDGNVKASDGEVKAGANNLQPPSKPGVAATPVPKRGTITRSTSPNPFMSSKDKGKGRANGGSQQPSPNMGYSRGLVALPIPFGDTLSLSAVLAPTSVDSATLPPASVPSVKPPTIGRIDVAATIAASSFDLAIAITAPTPVTATPADVGPIVEPAPAPSPAPIAQPHPPPPSPSISLRTVSNPLPAGSPSNNASGHKRSISLGSPFRPKTQRKANPSPSPSTPPRPTNFHPQAQQPSPVQLNPVQPNPPHLGTATVSAQFIGTGNSGPHGHFEPTPNGGYHNQWGPHHSNQPVLYPPGRAAPNQRAPPPFGSDQSRPSQAFSLFPTQHANVQVDASGQHYVLVNDEAGHQVFDIMFCDWMQPLNTSPMMVNLRQFMKGFIETLNPLYFVAAALVFRIIFHLPESPSAADERFKHAHRTVMRMAPELLRHFGDKCDNCGRRGFVGCWFFLPFSDRHCIQCGTGRPCSHDPAISGM
ncbi:hypothetical protein Q8F55_009253 [Vanrija albida]|uniref:Uncharacterized protein n=1 Tax=Vanrija albida TaxID=181172 RepID=A0ABR3PT40_9TREE